MFQRTVRQTSGLFSRLNGSRSGRSAVDGKTPRRSAVTMRRNRASRIEPLESRMLLVSDLVISEFMASNDTNINDEDNQTSDWIELLNVSNHDMPLGGWFLTDNESNLTQWKFPDRVLEPGESTIVFASGKDRTDGELHTNFRLSRSGEFLALVQPDGTTIADSYSPYPEQFPDVSYGPQQETIIHEYVTVGAGSKTLLPASAGQDVPTATWTAVGFDDSAWLDVTGPAGYDTDADDGDFGAVTPNGDLAAMNGTTPSAYVRTTFNIEGDAVPDLNTLSLNVNYDDGFSAYLNGSQVLSVNAPDTLAWDSTATAEHGGVAQKREYANFVDADDQGEFQLSGDADWFFGLLRLTTGEDNQTGAAWTREAIPFGADYSFDTYFQVDVYGSSRGTEGMAFVLQSGGNTRLGLGGGSLGLESTGMTYVAVELDTNAEGLFDEGAEYNNHIGINTSVDGSVARTEIDRWAGSRAGSGVRHVWIDYNGLSNQMDVYFAETNDKPDAPVVSASVDLAELFDGTPDLWAGWTAATSNSRPNTHSISRWNITSGAGQLGVDPVKFDISEHSALLKPGENVLAVHGLNLDANDEDFIIGATLTGTETVLTERKYFSNPTPGDVNGLGGLPPAGPVEFSVSTQVFSEPFTVEIAATSATEQIRYTTDGSLPDETSELYSEPILVDQSTRLRARAFEVERDPGPVSSEGYILLDSELTDFENGQPFESNLPIMVFESYEGRANRDSRRLAPVTAIFIAPGEDGRARITDEPEFAGRAGLRIRGQSSEGWPKKQYALEIWEEGNSDAEPIVASEAADRSVSFFGLPAESDWVLNGPYSDKTQLNNYLSFLWSNEMGLYAPRTRLVEVFVNTNDRSLGYITDPGALEGGDYRGTYVLLEKIKIDDNRVDITELSPRDNEEPEITGGYIWKKDKSGANDVIFTTDRNQQLRMVEPSTEITDQQKFWLNEHINQFEAALYGPDFKDPEEGYAKFIDVDSWIETWILVEMTKQIDGFRLSTYYHKDRGGKIKQGPPWDFNLSLSNANYLRGAYPDGWYGATINQDQYPYWDRLFEDPAFRQALTDRWQTLRSTIFTTENLLADVDAAVNLISDGNPNLDRPAEGEPSNPISRNFTRWRPTIDTYLWPNCYFGVDDCPRQSPLESADNPSGRPRTYGDYIFIMKDWIERRMEWMDDQFLAQPAVSLASGIVPAQSELTLSSEVGTIVYTTNGQDPREFVSGSQEETYLASGAQADVAVPLVIDQFANAIVQACNGSPLADPSQCMMHPDYTLGTHGESWTSGPTPVGFDDRTNFSSIIQTDIGPMMNKLSTTAFMRIPFEVTADQLRNAASVSLQMRYDDGFIAYLWSDADNLPVEIARANADGDPQTLPITPMPVSTKASRSHNNRDALTYEVFDISDAMQYMRDGTNVLFLHALNQSTTNGDFLMDPLIVAKRKLNNLPDGVFQYDGPITINENTRIVARTFDQDNDDFSGPLTVTYLVEEPQLVISELNYNPVGPTATEEAAGFTNGDDFEFIEIQNQGTQATNLAGTELTQGVDFVFPSVHLEPGERAVIVSNLAAFQQRYGTDIPVVGQYAGNLNNNGEGITLVNGIGNVIADFAYADSSLWPQSADGFGASLQLVDSMSTPVEQSGKHYHWRGSTEFGGSPGSDGSAPVGIVVNEVLANTRGANAAPDAIELYNTTSEPVDVSGWYLSDSGNTPLKYRLPDSTSIAGNGYLVVDELQFNADSAGENGFALSGTRGDDVWLVISDGNGGVSTFVDDIHFGATASNESLGRVPNGGGRLAPMSSTTLGAENAAPRIGPVVISEVNYNPGAPSDAARAVHPTLTSADLEFVEVHNPTEANVALTDWRIRGGIDYDFPLGTPLVANGTLVVVSFNPGDAANASRLNAFRAHYGIGEGVNIMGPYVGQLNNDGERVELQRPDAPTGDPPFIPRLLEDEVVFDDLTPWPTDADGAGRSLSRTLITGWGNDAGSWTASNPTPGSLVAFTPQAGDANMDGQFDQKDIVAMLQAGKYNTGQPATYGEGDFNNDGVFNQLDIVEALQTGNYLQGPYLSESLSKSEVREDLVDELFEDESLISELRLI